LKRVVFVKRNYGIMRNGTFLRDHTFNEIFEGSHESYQGYGEKPQGVAKMGGVLTNGDAVPKGTSLGVGRLGWDIFPTGGTFCGNPFFKITGGGAIWRKKGAGRKVLNLGERERTKIGDRGIKKGGILEKGGILLAEEINCLPPRF